jgi:hypothetical protein
MSTSITIYLLIHKNSFDKDSLVESLATCGKTDATGSNFLFRPEEYLPIRGLRVPCYDATVAKYWDAGYDRQGFELDGDKFYYWLYLNATIRYGRKYCLINLHLNNTGDITCAFLSECKFIDESLADFCGHLKEITGAVAWCIRNGDSLIVPSGNSFAIVDSGPPYHLSPRHPDALAPILIAIAQAEKTKSS